ncbi:MAG TPA: group I intron-associated PD-(D/E)XK endonuclease [Gaiellaceae bacterium]|nr:group I intron-associated PD-(D/E)XK endonuclease [Gaiellaceae bacterium]
MENPKVVGDRSLMMIAVALEARGFDVFLPMHENTRVDLISSDGHHLRKVQCKTGRLRNGCVLFATCSTYGHHPNPKILKRPYHGEIDDFAVYCPELGSVYVIPIEDVPTRTAASLRIERPRNNQTKRIRLAGAYEIARIDVY